MPRIICTFILTMGIGVEVKFLKSIYCIHVELFFFFSLGYNLKGCKLKLSENYCCLHMYLLIVNVNRGKAKNDFSKCIALGAVRHVNFGPSFMNERIRECL